MKRFVSIALIASLAACSGHSGGGMLPATNGGGSHASTPLRFSIKIPNAPQGIRPQHVSSSTLGVGVTTYAQSDTGHSTSIGYFGNDVSPSSPTCSSGPVFRVCTIQAAAPAGADEMVVTTYDQAPNGSGFFDVSADALDTGNVDFTVLEGQSNSIAVSLGGIPAQVNVAIDNPNAIFDTALYATIPYNVEVSVLDASGATIIGADLFSSPIVLSSSDGNAVFTIDGSPGTVVPKPNSVVTMVDASTAHHVPTLVATGPGGVIGTVGYEVNPSGTTTRYASSASPTAIVSGTQSNEVGQPGVLFYADATEEINKFDAITYGNAVLSYSGATPEALHTTAMVQNRFAGLDVSFATAFDGTQVYIGNSDGSSALLDNTIVTTGDCNGITNGANGSRILACGDQIIDSDYGVDTEFAGRTFGGIVSGANGALFYAFDASPAGGIGTMLVGDIGGTTDTSFPLASGHYATAIVACPDSKMYFLDGDHADSTSWSLDSITTDGTSVVYPVTGTPTALTCGPDNAVWFGTADGTIERFDIGTAGTTTESTSPGGSIGGIALGPDGAIWATDTPNSQLLRIIP